MSLFPLDCLHIWKEQLEVLSVPSLMTFTSSRVPTNHSHSFHRTADTTLTPNNAIYALLFPSLCHIIITPPNCIPLKLLGARSILSFICISSTTAGCWFTTGVPKLQRYTTSECRWKVWGQSSKSHRFISQYYWRKLYGTFKKEFFPFLLTGSYTTEKLLCAKETESMLQT